MTEQEAYGREQQEIEDEERENHTRRLWEDSMTPENLSARASFAKKWTEVQKQCGTIAKDAKNPQFGYGYTSEIAMKAVIGPALSEHGFAVFPSFDLLRWDEGQTKAGGASVMATVRVSLEIVDADTGWSEHVFGLASGQDTQDKAIAKATTAAWKVAMTAALSIARDDDPDADKGVERGAPKAKAKPKPLPPKPKEGPKITDKQRGLLWGKTTERVQTQVGADDDLRKISEKVLRKIIGDLGLDSTNDVLQSQMDGLLSRIESFDVAELEGPEDPF